MVHFQYHFQLLFCFFLKSFMVAHETEVVNIKKILFNSQFNLTSDVLM